MPRIRSLLNPVQIDVVQRAHDCQGNSAHRLAKGERRLAVKKERGWDYYCLACGVKMLGRDAERIKLVLAIVEEGTVTTSIQKD